MKADEFQLLAAADTNYEPSAWDLMTPPTLDEYTAALETIRSEETGRNWFQRQGFTQPDDPYTSATARLRTWEAAQGLNQAAAQAQYQSEYQSALAWAQSHPDQQQYAQNLLAQLGERR